ncbi:MAG: class I SAM-dependent methyltransferase [Dechloromonas sp.]|nr:class I SAM-dependent methyltransferase [Dechloromonas sp.]
MTKVFDAYASYYDLVYRDKDYAAEAEYVASHIRHNAPGAKRILELGCGTGGHGIHLAQMGYVVHGVDLSEAMLSRALARKGSLPPEVAARLTFTRDDVRTVHTGETYDVVISLFHVMSYQVTNADLAAAFETASSHLRSDGLFLFDFWYGPAVLTEKPEVRVKRLENGHIEVTRIAEPVLNSNESTVQVNYTLFVKDKATGNIEQTVESHKLRYLFLTELQHYLAGRFVAPKAFEWMTQSPLSENTWSAFVCAART